MKLTQSYLSYFLLFLLFNLCFFFLQVAFHYANSTGFTSAIPLPWAVYLELISTFGVHIILYALLSVLQTWLLVSIIYRSWHYFSADVWQIIIWTLTVCALLSANAYLFPLSAFSELCSPFFSADAAYYILILALIGLGLLLVNSLLYWKTLLCILILTPVLIILAWYTNVQTPVVERQSKQPNIIIIGVDSLSPEQITQEKTPFLYHLLKQSTHFSQAISPLARTSPAWYSILTGLYAKHHFAYENLVDKKTLNNNASILWQINPLGYYSVFATDDRRFNEVDELLGFKQIIGPKIGVNDFLLGTYNDFPLSNLLINLPFSSVIFPYNFINRASVYGYYPKTFDRYLIQQLKAIPADNAVFLAVHFALPHWPYAWAETSAEQLNDQFNMKNRGVVYQNALKKVDQQVQSLYAFLEKKHYFNNSLLIFLSDHGETLYEPHSRLTSMNNYQGTGPSLLASYFEQHTDMELDKSAGHGSDILSPSQYHCVLGFTIFQEGKKITNTKQIDERVALFDIAPTILNYLSITPNHVMDGVSLLPSILNSAALPIRTFFIESGMLPNQTLSLNRIMNIGQQLYQVNPENNQLEIKSTQKENVFHQKLYGAIHGDWIYALYPLETFYIPVIQNLKTGQWSDNLNTPFAKSSPAKELSEELATFYKKQLAFPVPKSMEKVKESEPRP